MVKNLKFKQWNLFDLPNWEDIAYDDDPLDVLTNYYYHVWKVKIIQYHLKNEPNMLNSQIYYFMAKEFGFTPDEVNNMDSLIVYALIQTHININKRR